MESYHWLSKRYATLLSHYKSCKCDCALNTECLILYACLKELLAKLIANAEILGRETILFLKPPEEPTRCQSACNPTEIRKNPSSI